ncbi:MAG: hypothetical protein WA151_21530, partial [Desulfatirhabdiaceae bacterium]
MVTMPESNFRKASVNRLSSSEQLDHLMKVTASKDWLVLALIASLVIAAFFWSVFGRIPIRVNGNGILIRSGGIYEIVSLSSGQIVQINFDAGDMVTTGDVVARISQPIQLTRLNHARIELAEMKQELQRLRDSVEKDMRQRRVYSDNERNNLMKSIDFELERLRWLREKLVSQDILLQQGLITKQSYANTKHEINASQERIETDRNQLRGISISDFQLKDQKERDIRNSEQQILKQERETLALKK